MSQDITTLPGYDAAAPLLEVRDLCVTFGTHEGDVPAVRHVSFTLRPGETLCVLGESGSGKSVTQMAVMGLIPTPPGRVTGKASFRGIKMTTASKSTQLALRGSGLAMIFQDAIAALNPALTVGYQIAEVFCARSGASRSAGRKRAIELMEQVAIPAAKERVDDYPFQFSGGMCQRIVIAMALALDPKVLIADEPTTALDVTVQRQVMALLKRLGKELDLALLLITHDLGVAAEQADRILVMYAGQVVEEGPTERIFAAPHHPYTEALLASMPDIAGVSDRLGVIDGSPPVLSRLPAGCAFHPRCRYAKEQCKAEKPVLQEAGDNRTSACLRMAEIFRPEAVHV
uniref:ABC transporter ATP-binding protein n=1 Tax=Pararhizobium sp. IMCC3301 TaxID=3067904 RepID=UPI0027403B4C|nr:ABC transporter ATP-binding protein [Pararhizobium sp. IMCC3301]